MIKNLIVFGLAYYFYTDMQKKLRAAMDDRNSLLAMLTPEQRSQLIQGLQAAENAAKQVASDVVSTMQAAGAATSPVTTPVSPTQPLSGRWY